MTLCECGCGQEAKPGNRFIHGHSGGGQLPPPVYVAEEDRFIPGTGIDRITTIKEMGYDPIYLKRSTRRKFFAVCLDCGVGRWVSKYYDLCLSCSEKGERNPMFGKPHSIEHIAKIATRSTEYWSDPIARDTQSKRGLQYFIDNPEAGEAQSNRLKNSDAAKESQEKQRGGDDIVKHHFIYDHDNPDKHVVKIARSQHAAHHHWMRRSGIKVPHLNINKYNKSVFKGRNEYV